MKPRAVLVLRDRPLIERIGAALAAAGCEVGEVLGFEEVESRLADVVCDLLLVGREALAPRFRQAVERLRRLSPECDIVGIQSQEGGEERASLLAAGCLGTFPDDLSDAGLGLALGAFAGRVRERLARAIEQEAAAGAEAPEVRPRSAAMVAVLEQERQLAGSDVPILLLGETGTGKGWLARRIHRGSRRRGGPFVAVNCGAIPATLWESELFGHERGAFTGADRTRRGHFETAAGGTLFLDEIGETPLDLQVKLLRALDDQEIRRLGGERTIDLDARIVAASNRDLEAEMEAGRFRQDLWYRLAVVTLWMPPLRERREDIEPLARSFLSASLARTPKAVEGFSADTVRAFLAYDWPGNVRELANVVERAALLAGAPEITPGELPLRIAAAAQSLAASVLPFPHRCAPGWLDRSLPDLRREVTSTLEREYLRAQLAHTGGRLGEVARRAGIDRRSLFNKMRELGLDKDEFRPARDEARRKLRGGRGGGFLRTEH